MADKKAKTILGLILALVVAGLLIGYVFPVGMNAMNEDKSSTYTFSSGDTETVATNLNATLDAINSGNGTVNMTLTDTESGTSYTITQLEVGSNTTVSTDLGEVTVSNENWSSSDSTNTVKFTHTPEFGWSNSQQTIFGILGIFFVLVILVALAGWAMKAFR